MSKERSKDEVMKAFHKIERIKAPEQAREKSLASFKEGLRTAEGKQNRMKQRNRRNQNIFGFASTLTAAAIIIILAFSTGIVGEQSKNEFSNQESNSISVADKEQEATSEEKNSFSIDELRDKLLERKPSFFSEDTSFTDIFDDQLFFQLPSGWEVSETTENGVNEIRMTGEDGEKMSLLLFHDQNNQDGFNDHLKARIEPYAGTEQVELPVKDFVNKIQELGIYSSFENFFPFETETAEMDIFLDEEKGTFLEVYTSELFGYPMIFTAELALEDEDSWELPLQFFDSLSTREPFVVQGSEGELHDTYNRPVEKEVLLPIGAIYAEIVEMELYENEEMQVTTYVPKDASVEKIEHDYFIEWRFTEPQVPDSSFYSFGKLRDNFPLENAREVMLNAFDIGLAHADEESSAFPYSYSYDSSTAMSEAGEGYGVGGSIQLFEVDGEWYYRHKHASWDDYNGGHYIARLDYLIESLEWH